MTRYQIEFEGMSGGQGPVELESVLEAAMAALLDAGATDLSVSGALAKGRIEVAFVIEADGTGAALDAAHGLLARAASEAGLSAEWRSAQAHVQDPETHALA